jgi:hypothetical protein
LPLTAKIGLTVLLALGLAVGARGSLGRWPVQLKDVAVTPTPSSTRSS